MKYDVVVIGAGPAGVCAAIYLKRAGKKVCILEKNAPGGKLNTIANIENYLGYSSIAGPDLAMDLFKQINHLNIELKIEEALFIKEQGNKIEIKTQKNKYEANYVILATGRENRKLNLEGERQLEGKGVSYCAICDGPLYKDKDVVVIGGGVSALEEATYLSRFCKEVSIINKNATFKAEEALIQKVKETENIKIYTNSKIKKYNKEDEKLNSITIEKENREIKISAEGCFVFIGTQAQTKLLSSIVTDENGYVLVNENYETSNPHIYACGDSIKKGVYQIITAASEGACAALNIVKKLR